MADLKVAIVHDYLTQRGGAERVVLSMLKTFPDAPLFTALYEPDSTYPEFANYDVRPLATNRVAALRNHHRRGLLLYPFAFSRLRVDADLVLCSSSGFAHGARTKGRKVVYCYTPPRWLYNESGTYLAGWPGPVTALARIAGPVLRRWDKRAAATADLYMTSSAAVRERISRTYNIDATVVAPPVRPMAGGKKRIVPGVEAGFLLCVSRLLAYKNVEAVVRAFAELPDNRLVVVGTGREANRLAEIAGPNVALVGRVDDDELSWLYTNCAGVLAAAHEDFGLTPVEAASHGKPVAALRAGGFLDTVVEGKTGVFFDQPTPRSIAAAVRALVEHPWDQTYILSHAEYFLEAMFEARLMAALGFPDPVADPDGLVLEAATGLEAAALDATVLEAAGLAAAEGQPEDPVLAPSGQVEAGEA